MFKVALSGDFLKDDGTFRLDQKYFNYATGLTMTNDKFNKLFF